MATYTVSVLCPYCQSDGVVKNGTRKGKQLYKCQSCRKQFRDTGATNGHHIAADQIGAALEMYYRGMSFKQVGEAMERMYDRPEPSKATIFEWVRDYTEQAAAEMEDHKAQTGDHWVADELVVDVGGEKAWLWNVMDGKTRYILASHLSKERDGEAAKTVMRKALANADKPPDYIFTDKLRSYLPALKEVLPKTKHFQSQGFAADINNNLSERLQGTYRSRIKTLRGLDSLESGQRYLDGWQITYNLFRDHESLHGDTPGKRAKVNPSFTEWADVVKGGTTPQTFAIPQEAKLIRPKADDEELKLPNLVAKVQLDRAERRAPPPTEPVTATRPKAKAPRNPRHHPFYQLREPRGRSAPNRR